ncbi:histone-lysine N-methyltransferase SETMAR-like [Penaeus monodon]|uniref:histone-lysine N-methyltransferase SETMAR-like n=1 Tax=Penaeus monodon TaxID=6687 RepID=UPI0018A6D850|nr:histone-lysine N-methyltransferase SETMAR-like [Penaeus monodon]
MDFLAKGTAITEPYYDSLLQKLREAIKTKGLGMLTKGVCLLQGNAPVHNSLIAHLEARSCGYDNLPHPPYSLDLAPCDFHLFPSIKSFLEGKRVQDDETLISEVTSWLQTQPADFY